MADPRIRQITIKTGVVKRLAKDLTSYKKEVEQEKTRFETKKANGADDHELNKQNEVINESKAMIPDTANRLRKNLAEFKTYLENEKDLAENDQYKAANKEIEEAEKVLKDDTQQECA